MTTRPAEHPTSPEYYTAPPPRGLNPWLVRLPILFVSGAILLVLILTILVGVYQLRFRDRIIPGVSAYGLDLAGMTTSEAIRALESRFTYADQAVFTLRDGDRFWQLSAGDLGVALDAQSTVVEAFAAGHSGNPILDVVDQALVWLNGHSVAPIIRYDQNLAARRLVEIAEEINRRPVDASLRITGSTVATTPGVSGRTVDVSATLHRLDTAILQMNQGGEIALVINETPPIAWDADSAAEKARAALSGPVVFVADDGRGGTLGPWTASVEQIGALLTVQTFTNTDGTQRYDVTIAGQAFRAYLADLARGLIMTPQNARFHFNDTSGQLELLQPAINGRALNIDETIARFEQAVFNPGNRIVPLAFDYTLPRYHDNVTAAELGITELISTGISYYTGSTAARRENIAVSAARFDGLIIGPGEVFSFNQWVGDISPEEGYVSGKVILGGRTVDGVGGGVCQVSTTAFRAAFYAGYPILERYAHGYRVGYYEDNEGVGMDAAIYTPDLDFRFLNDTDYHLLIETSVLPGSNSVQFRFYSTNPGRQVVKRGPEIANVTPPAPTQYEVNPELGPGQSLQVDWSAEGAEVRVTRVILDAGGSEIKREVFYSRYEPWGAVIQVAPGDGRASG